MGYYTYFKLQLEPENFDIIKEIRNNDPDSGFAWALDNDGNAADSAKWYEWEEDMQRISKNYPNYIFHLSGEGEENDDLWKADFWNGHIQIRRAIVTYPPFDPTFGGNR